MAQKSITSFFKPKTTKCIENNEETNESRSPEQSAVNKRRRTLSNSEDDSPIKRSSKVKCNKSIIDSSDDEQHEKARIEKSEQTKDFVKDAKPNNKEKDSQVKLEPLDKTPTAKLISNDVKSENANKNQQTGENYNPAKPNYHPINDAFWKHKQSTPYLALARTFQSIEEIRSRLQMIEVLSNFFSSVILLNPDDLLPCVYLSINQVAPAYEGLELGVAEHSLMKIICSATGRKMDHIKSQTQEIGDLGIVAEQSRISQRMMFQPAPLTVRNVFQKLRNITKLSGPSKSNVIHEIFVACRFSEARYFIRSLIGKLRIGIAEQSLLYALAIAITQTPPNKEDFIPANLNTLNKMKENATFKATIDKNVLLLRTVFSQCPNYDKVISTILEFGLDNVLERCRMEPGVPLKPMLAQPVRGIQEVLERLEGVTITCEWKYDGERAQIHCDEKGNISIYSRNQENNTSKYPDIISRAVHFKKDNVTSYIIDSEIVAWDVEQKTILPFQILSTRKRKNVDETDIKVQVCVYAFDLLYLNGESLVTKNFIDRRQLMKDNFQEIEGEWKFATSINTNDVTEVQQFLDESIKGNCEGLMVKTLNSEATYEIAKRSRNWLKLKKDYLSGVGDSLDLVVIGGYKGKGKRTGIYGCFLLACYDDENEEYQSICKIGTGFSEEDLRVHANFLKDYIINEPKSYYRFDNSLEPDVWFDPIQIWEVKCADLSLSPIHKAAIGIVDPEKGISLRFPRFIRIRDDKSAENSTSAQQVADMYSSQDQIKNTQKTGNNEFENDFY